jgi:uncharacterized iron-regulated membrane protein
MGAMPFRRLILYVHLAVALIAGAFIALLGVTGSIMAFEPELDRLFHPHLSYVSSGPKVLTLQEIGDAVSRKFDGEPIVAYLPSESPNLSSEVVLPRGIVCVNQYTGEVLGVRARGQTALGFARALHIRLASGDVGRTIMKWSGPATLVSLASGLYLWWPGKRIRIRNWRSKGFWFDLHNSTGVFFFLPLFVLAVTGTVIGFEDQAAMLLNKLSGRTEVRREVVAQREAAPGAAVITADQAVAIALAQMPGTIAYRVQMPRYGGAYRVSLEYPRDRVTGGRNLIAIDQYAGSVISSTRSSELSVGERILATNESIHTGEILGVPTKILMWLTSVVAPVQVISGLLVWWRRRNTAPAASRTGAGAL